MKKKFYWHYNKKTIRDFIKAMEESKIIKIGTHKKDKCLMLFDKVCSLTEEQLRIQFEGDTGMLRIINSEFHDWLETYQGDKKYIH